MANYIVKDTDLTAIANAIREKTASSETMKVTEMPEQIKGIQGGTDTSADTVISEALVEGYTAHDKDGKQITGINPYELNSTNTAVEAQVDLISQIQTALEGKAAGGGSGNETEWSENEDAIITRTLSTYTNDRVTSIGNYAFYGHFSLTTVSFPKCTSIGYSAFYSCSSLTTASFPACTTIGANAFRYCSSLASANFPKCTNIGSSAFDDCSSLASVSFPACTSIGSWAFAGCSSFTSVNFPACTEIGSRAFYACKYLTTAIFPACTNIIDYAFFSCKSLTTVNFPVCISISSSVFCSCHSLKSVSFPKCTDIGGSNAFKNCYNLTSLYLTGSSLCTLSNSNAFTSTPIGGYSASAGCYGSIYVPQSLLASYQTATNWTYFSSRFVGINGSND